MSKIIDLANKVEKEVLLSSVILSRLKPNNRGVCLCPFHEDETYGSFSYSDDKNYWKCFSCGAGGNSINFIQKLDQVPFREAVLRIALDGDIITKEDYLKRSFLKNYVQGSTLKKTTNRKYKKQRAEAEFTDKVYSLMASLFPLNENHLHYLRDARGLSDEQIKECGYFSMPDTLEKRKALLNLTTIHGLNLDRIPGFYQKENQREVLELSGVGIPIKNANGLIQAIQVRKDFVEKGEPRYVFFSTSKEGGTSSGAPVDVVFPENIKNSRCFITEGHFKADALARKTNSICISLQGVNNTHELPTTLNDLVNEYEIDEWIIAFDVDMLKNKHVINAALKLENLLKENFKDIKVSYVSWDANLEKGIDDVIIAKHAKHIKKIDSEEFRNRLKEYVKAVEGLYQEGFGRKAKLEVMLKSLYGKDEDCPYRDKQINLWNKIILKLSDN